MKRKLQVTMSAICTLALSGCENLTWSVQTPQGNIDGNGKTVTITPRGPVTIPIIRAK